MVGLCGVLGDGDLPDAMASWTQWRDDETRVACADERVEFVLSNHASLAGDQPATAADGEVRVWVWGDVYGRVTGDGYVPRDGPTHGSARYCARQYRERGLAFVEELNGDFLLVVHDRRSQRLAFVTDRWATHPLYYARPDDDSLVVTSALQSLSAHPSVDVTFDRDLLYEYLALRRVFGVETPLVGVEEFPPASVVEVDLHDLSTEVTTYWRPRYDPVDRPFSHFVDRLSSTLRDVFAEWTDDDRSYGVLLSGGSDSRLVQAAIDQPVVSFHNADWMSREARVARRVAERSGDEFRLLTRYEDHEARSLDETPRLSSFSGWFDQAYFTAFESDIVEDVDVLTSGLFADMLFAGGPLATRSLSLGSVGTVSLPARRPIASVDDYVCEKLEERRPLPYYDAPRPLRKVVSDAITRTEDGIASHGVRYGSLTDLVMYGDYYPLGADTEAIFPRSLMQMCPYRTPFLDARIFDVHRRMPRRYLLRRNVIDAAVERIAPDLAAIPHARTGVPLKYPFPVEFLGTQVHGFYRKHVAPDSTPAPHLDHKPWPNREELLRARPFAADRLGAKESTLRRLPFLDESGAWKTYEAHVDGANNTTALYSLLTFLEMPLVADYDGDSGRTATPQFGPASDGGSVGTTEDP